MQLRGYQKRLVDEILRRKNVCLSVGMGLGKTISVLTALDYIMYTNDYQSLRVLIVAPKRVAETVWLQEAEQWGLWKLRACMALVSGTKEKKLKMASDDYVAQIKIVSRDNIALFAGRHFDIVVIDELTSFKSWTLQRSKIMRGITANKKIGLTGTFAPNGIIDIYPQLSAIGIAGDDYYGWRGRWFEDVMRGSGQSFQKWQLRNGVSPYNVLSEFAADIITLSTDDYIGLPPVVEVPQFVNLSKEERKAYDDLVTTLHFELPDDDAFETTDNAVFAKIQTLTSGFVYDDDGNVIRLEHGGSKIRAAVDKCCECRDNGEHVLLLYHFRESAIWFHELATAALLRVCSTSAKGWLDKWNNGDIDVLVANPQSSGHGLNLQRGGHVAVWMELTYDYELFAQANARLRRPGQTEQVVAYYMISNDTCDVNILRSLARKKKDNDLVERMTKI
ncbi:MAG: DEAD/DEAH box helicase [Bacteroidales bacterium]|nr:DEAD/DEAH box helicase [Bacteroidales bacterium]